MQLHHFVCSGLQFPSYISAIVISLLITIVIMFAIAIIIAVIRKRRNRAIRLNINVHHKNPLSNLTEAEINTIDKN